MSGETKAQVSGWTIDTVYMHLGARLDDLGRLTEQKFTDNAFAYAEKFKHMEQMFVIGQTEAKRAVDKAEAAQNAHNVASNEWRGTLNDFKATLVGRPEFDRFYAEFSAFRLEQSRVASGAAGQKAGQREYREDNKSFIAIVISVAAVAVMIVTAFLGARV